MLLKQLSQLDLRNLRSYSHDHMTTYNPYNQNRSPDITIRKSGKYSHHVQLEHKHEVVLLGVFHIHLNPVLHYEYSWTTLDMSFYEPSFVNTDKDGDRREKNLNAITFRLLRYHFYDRT